MFGDSGVLIALYILVFIQILGYFISETFNLIIIIFISLFMILSFNTIYTLKEKSIFTTLFLLPIFVTFFPGIVSTYGYLLFNQFFPFLYFLILPISAFLDIFYSNDVLLFVWCTSSMLLILIYILNKKFNNKKLSITLVTITSILVIAFAILAVILETIANWIFFFHNNPFNTQNFKFSTTMKMVVSVYDLLFMILYSVYLLVFLNLGLVQIAQKLNTWLFVVLVDVIFVFVLGCRMVFYAIKIVFWLVWVVNGDGDNPFDYLLNGFNFLFGQPFYFALVFVCFIMVSFLVYDVEKREKKRNIGVVVPEESVGILNEGSDGNEKNVVEESNDVKNDDSVVENNEFEKKDEIKIETQNYINLK